MQSHAQDVLATLLAELRLQGLDPLRSRAGRRVSPKGAQARPQPPHAESHSGNLCAQFLS